MEKNENEDENINSNENNDSLADSINKLNRKIDPFSFIPTNLEKPLANGK